MDGVPEPRLLPEALGDAAQLLLQFQAVHGDGLLVAEAVDGGEGDHHRQRVRQGQADRPVQRQEQAPLEAAVRLIVAGQDVPGPEPVDVGQVPVGPGRVEQPGHRPLLDRLLAHVGPLPQRGRIAVLEPVGVAEPGR